MSAGRPVGPDLDEQTARLVAELRRHPLGARGAVVMRSDVQTALDLDADAVELLVSAAVATGQLASAVWLTPSTGEDAALVALLAPTTPGWSPGGLGLTERSNSAP